MSYAKRILEKTQTTDSKPFRTNIYVKEKSVWDTFVKNCDAHGKTASSMLETMMRDFNESVPTLPKKK